MSARREKRLRRLERRVEALEDKVARENIAKAAREISEVLEAQDADLAPAPLRRSLWRRLLDAIMGRDEP